MSNLHQDRYAQAASMLASGVHYQLVEVAYGYVANGRLHDHAKRLDTLPESACEGCGCAVTYRTAYYLDDHRFCRGCRAELFVTDSALRRKFHKLFAQGEE